MVRFSQSAADTARGRFPAYCSPEDVVWDRFLIVFNTEARSLLLECANPRPLKTMSHPLASDGTPGSKGYRVTAIRRSW